MKKFKISQTVQLGTVLTKEEMMQIQGKTSEDIENCKCKLHLVSPGGSEDGGKSHQDNAEKCKEHCNVVCNQRQNCYSNTAIFVPGGFNTGSGSGHGSGNRSGL